MTMALIKSTGMRTPSHRKRRDIFDYIPPTPVRDEDFVDRSERSTPDWRWKYVDKYHRLKSPIPRTRKSDPLIVNSIYPFMVDYNDKKDSAKGLEEVKAEYPELTWAVETFDNNDSSSIRWFIEAYICADMSAHAIANIMFIPAEYIWWYEKTFFDVREILDNPERMETEIFIKKSYAEDKIVDFLWKAIAWKHGLGVEGLRCISRTLGDSSPEVVGAIRNIIEKKLATDTVMALRGRKINTFNENLVIDQFQRAVESKVHSEEDEFRNTADSGMKDFLFHLSNHVGIADLDGNFNGIEGAVIGEEPGENMFRNRLIENAKLEESNTESL